MRFDKTGKLITLVITALHVDKPYQLLGYQHEVLLILPKQITSDEKLKQ
ncbi:hypothetical protein [Colwellia psychrerythraea]|nr:hypothetical protein [Colwellia psychrerythraea]